MQTLKLITKDLDFINTLSYMQIFFNNLINFKWNMLVKLLQTAQEKASL